MWTIELPLTIPVSKNRKFSLNLNQYRNEHFQTLNTAKVNFAALVKPLLRDVPVLTRVHITYTLFARSQQRVDTSNICAIVDKFFSDVLVAAGKLADDHCHILPSVTYRFSGVDKGNPRVEAEIRDLTTETEIDDTHSFSTSVNRNQTAAPEVIASMDQPKRERPLMQITIVQSEIEAAIKSHILNQIAVKDGMDINIDMRATRGEAGFQAIIDIVPSSSNTAKPAPVQAQPLGIRRQVEAAPVQAPAQEEEVSPALARLAGGSTTQAAPETDEPAVEAGEAPLKPSIFGGLKKPVNTGAEAEATA